MNVEIRNVISIDLGELLSNDKSGYCHRTIVIETPEGQVVIKLYSKNENALKVAV
jgi:hypothetical protein